MTTKNIRPYAFRNVEDFGKPRQAQPKTSIEELVEKYKFTPDREAFAKTRADQLTDLEDSKIADLVLCRRVKFGNNGNLSRYEPVYLPSKAQFKALLIRTIKMFNKFTV